MPSTPPATPARASEPLTLHLASLVPSSPLPGDLEDLDAWLQGLIEALEAAPAAPLLQQPLGLQTLLPLRTVLVGWLSVLKVRWGGGEGVGASTEESCFSFPSLKYGQVPTFPVIPGILPHAFFFSVIPQLCLPVGLLLKCPE